VGCSINNVYLKKHLHVPTREQRAPRGDGNISLSFDIFTLSFLHICKTRESCPAASLFPQIITHLVSSSARTLHAARQSKYLLKHIYMRSLWTNVFFLLRPRAFVRCDGNKRIASQRSPPFVPVCLFVDPHSQASFSNIAFSIS
jgi:hypothetical protein